MPEEIAGTLLLDPKVLNDPYSFYRRLRMQAPVWRVPETDVFVVTSYALLEEAAARVEDFSSNMRGVLYRDENGMPGRLPVSHEGMQVLATADPPEHTVHRKVMVPVFTPRRLALLEQEIADVATTCIEGALRNGCVDFMAEVANIVPITIISQLIGFTDSNLDNLLQAAFDSTAVVGGALSHNRLLEIGVRTAQIHNWITSQFEQAVPTGEDIMSSLKRAVGEATMEADHAVAVLHVLLAAGGESTTSLIGNAVRVLAEDQSLQARVRSNPELIPPLLEEVLRLESPFRSHLRSVPRETSLGDVAIPAGATVLMFWSAGNRDPAAFEKPDSIDLHRPRRHMTFGRGIHTCIGAPLARLEANTVIGMLLEMTSGIELDADRAPLWVESLQVRRHERLPVNLDPR